MSSTVQDFLAELRILVVEDDTDILRMVATVLETKGAKVTQSASGSAALATLEVQDFDAIIVDWNLGDMPGGAMLTALSDTHPALCSRTLVMTGELIATRDEHAAAKAGFAVLPKPFRPAALRDAIASLIG